ncbi:hypothetical protein [Comamonas composti]|uniref:hypothetical protein n=1 Tax=Comamonas composti TaxID=408558 RepID=UPI00040214F5|nr:hypothetical protein [Comamonas composti]
MRAFIPFPGRRQQAGLGLAALWLAMAGSLHAAQEVTAPQAANSVQAEREAERGRIELQRADIERRKTAAETLCYQRFAVEDCLRDVRRQAREELHPLRERELQLNQAQRRENAEFRRQQIEAKKADKAASGLKAQQRPPAQPRDTEALRSQREQQARERAAQQADNQRRHEAQQNQRQASEAQRRSQARADYEAKIRAAEERKARAAEAARERGPTAAPLPAP